MKKEESLDEEEEVKEAKEDLGVKEEALRAPYELEDLKGGGPTVDSGSFKEPLHEVSCIPSSLFFPLASSTVDSCVASSHEAAMGVDDGKEKGKGKEEEDLSLKHGERESQQQQVEKQKEEGVLSLKHGERESQQEHEGNYADILYVLVKLMEELGSGERESQQEHRLHQAPGALRMASASMPLVSLSQHLFHGRQDSERRQIRLGLPSNGHMVDETLDLLKDCGLPVERDSPQQCVATIPQLPNLRVFFQHSEEIVRNLSSGHLDIGIVGFDMVSECRQGNDDLIIVHTDLGYGHCHLSLAIPKNEIFERINSVKELAQMPQWTEENPLRVVTGLPNLGNKFMKENGLKHVSISTARGPLEAASAMETADAILNLVSSGTTLGDNNLKEIEGGTALESRAVLVASMKSLFQREDVRDTTREILERLEARLKAVGQIMLRANMSGRSAEEVAERVLSQLSLSGLRVEVSPAVSMRDGEEAAECYAMVICLPEKALYSSMRQLSAIGGSQVLACPLNTKEEEEDNDKEEGNEYLGVKEEALRAPYEMEDLKGGGPTVDSGSLHEDRDKEEEEEDKDEEAKKKEEEEDNDEEAKKEEEEADNDKEVGEDDLGVKEEALRAPYELEDQQGEGSTVDSSFRHEVSSIPSSLFFNLASLTQARIASSHEAAMGVADKKQKEKGKEKEDFSLKHGERESQLEHELQAPKLDQPTKSKSMPLVSPSQQLFHGREDSEHREIWLGLPSNGLMIDETLGLLKDCGLPVERDSPQQYVATIPQLPNSQVFFLRSEEIVRNLSSGHLDIGIVGLDTVSECGQGNDDLIIVHNDLCYGHCRLSLAIPENGIFERIISVKELAQMPQWTPENPLRVVTGLPNLGRKFMKENGLKHVSILTADRALEGFLQRGWADVILDIVSGGTKLRENNLKEIEGGTALETQAVLVASRKSLVQWEDVRETTREILERLEARFKAVGQIMVTAYMSGSSVEEVTKRVLSQPSLSGLQNPAVCQVFCQRDGKMVVDCYAIDICVPEKALHSSVQQLRNIGSSRVLISPSTSKWQQLLSKLEL